MGVEVKICGIASSEAADAAIRGGADFAGLVFHPHSPRHVSPDRAAELAARLRSRTRVVVLLSDPSDEDIDVALAATKADFVQLHGHESPERIASVKSRSGKPVIKAISIADASDFSGVPDFENVAEMLLFDAKAPSSSTRGGGHGAPFDWQLLRGRTFKRPWLLAGGLTADNVGRAIRASGATGVDVSSGVEIAPGVKSAELISTFIARVRSAHFAAEERA